MDATIRAKRIIPWIVAIALFMETLDITIISTTIPTMALSLMVDPISLKLALTSYLLSLALFIPVSGWVADKFGTQRVFLFALLLFTVSSIGCGMATHLLGLVAARIMQGIGGAFMMPVGRLILLRVFSKSELIRAMNFVTMPALFGPLLGPLVGGFIITYYSWRWIFYVNVPVGLLGIFATLRYIENFKAIHLRPFDTVGFFLFGMSLIGVFFAFESIGESFIPTHLAVLVGSCGLLGFLLFYWHYQRVHYAVLNLKLFSIRTFLVAALGNVWGRLGLSSVPFLLPLLFQIGYDLSPLHSGLLTFVGTIGMITMKFMNKAILHRFGFKKALSAFSLMAGMTISSFALISEINVPLIIVLVFLNGLVSSLLYTAMNVLYYVDLSPADMSNATSISSMLQQMSMGFGITLSGVVLRIFVGWNNKLVLGNPIPFRLAFIVMGAISFLSVLVFLKLKSNDGQEASGSYS